MYQMCNSSRSRCAPSPPRLSPAKRNKRHRITPKASRRLNLAKRETRTAQDSHTSVYAAQPQGCLFPEKALASAPRAGSGPSWVKRDGPGAGSMAAPRAEPHAEPRPVADLKPTCCFYKELL